MINIAKLLKNAPKGMKLYSPLFGEVEFLYVNSSDNNILVATDRHTNYCFTANGIFHMYKCHPHAECLLFPSKDCRTWEGWKAPAVPKFKSRDWVVRKDGKPFCSGNYVEQITLIGVDAKGTHMFLSSSTWVNEDEDVIRLWTIQDAKDGDVLVTEDYIFIFKCILHGGVHLYCHYDIDDEEFDSDIPDAIIGNIHDKGVHFRPVTKEQHDLLFKKMKEAGYTWDEKKKELKKIPIKPNFKVGDWITDGISKCQIHFIDNTQYWYSENCILGSIESVNKRYHLWEISDAKDGDVLVDVYGNISIYEKCDDFDWVSYCSLGHNGGFQHFKIEHENEKTYPATKEQRDLLFRKMREAGYQWNADKEELSKIKLPNFKTGDWIITDKNHVWFVDKDCSTTGYLYRLIALHGKVEVGEYEAVDAHSRLWTIADAKDGDVLVCYGEVKDDPIEQVGIFKQYVGKLGGCSHTFLAYTGIDWDGNIIINGFMGSTNILPATKEQRDRLFAKIKEVGYEWDGEKKELHKIRSHYDIANFKPKQWVLVRNCDNQVWGLSMFSHRDMGCYICLNREDFTQCIPLEGNEKLLGTTDPCPKEFINW